MATEAGDNSRLMQISEGFRNEQMAKRSVSTATIGKDSEYNNTNPAVKSDGDLWGKNDEVNPGNSEDIMARNMMETRNTLFNKQREYNSSSVNTPIRK